MRFVSYRFHPIYGQLFIRKENELTCFPKTGDLKIVFSGKINNFKKRNYGL